MWKSDGSIYLSSSQRRQDDHRHQQGLQAHFELCGEHISSTFNCPLIWPLEVRTDKYHPRQQPLFSPTNAMLMLEATLVAGFKNTLV